MKLLTTLLATLICASVVSQDKITRDEYIATWCDVAVQQMKNYRIPASITLAQGILESASGNSYLAQEANNHFGIKCKAEWEGDYVVHGSPEGKDFKIEESCFRKYPNASDSYEDHSLFLKRSRYLFLYELNIMSYKKWAKGLSKAGYATDPNYAKKLIDIIKRYDLHQYDKLEK